MGLVSALKNAGNAIVGFPSKTWSPFNISPDQSIFSSAYCITSKFLGRVVTLTLATGITALALSILSKTLVGKVLGITAFVVTVKSYPIIIMIIFVASAILGTCLLSSFLIEKYA